VEPKESDELLDVLDAYRAAIGLEQGDPAELVDGLLDLFGMPDVGLSPVPAR